MNRPGKSEWYQMQTANEVRRVLSRSPSQYTAGQMRMRFVPGGQAPDESEDPGLDTEKEQVFKVLGGGRYTPPTASESDPAPPGATDEYETGEIEDPDVSQWDEDPLL